MHYKPPTASAPATIRARPTPVAHDGSRKHRMGQAGFFAFFNVTFRYAKREMDIRWVRGA